MKKRTGYLFKRNMTYYLECKIQGRRFVQSLGTKNKREAEAEAARILAPLQAEATVETLAAVKARLEVAADTAAALGPSVLLGQAWTAYLEAEKRRTPGPGTLADYKSMFEAFMRWMSEHHPDAKTMRMVSADHARTFLRYLDKDRGLSGDRVNKHRNFLRSMFKLLAKSAALAANPWDETIERDHTAAHRRPLTVEEMRLIIEAAEGELKTLFMVGTFTGLRLGDCATLRWDETDLVRGIIHRKPRKTARRGLVVTIGIPEVLGQHLAGLDRSGPYVTPETAHLYLARKEYLSRRIQAHFVKCGITTLGEGAGKRAACVAGFHSLRHSYVSMHAAAGTSLPIMQKLVGHKNPMMTEHYTTIDDATAKRTAASLPAILGTTEPQGDPLPAWAVEAVINARTLKELRAILLKGIMS